MTPSPSRRRLLGASLLPAALSLVGCGSFRGGDEPSQDPVAADGSGETQTVASPDRCLSDEDASRRARPEPPARADAGPENEAIPDRPLSEYGLALFAGGERLAAQQTSDALMLGESDTFGTLVWSTADGTILERHDNGLVGAIAADSRGRLAIGGVTTVELREADGEVLKVLTGGEEPFGPRIGNRVGDLALTADGTRLVVLGADGRVTIWHLEDETCEVEHEIAAELGTVIALSLSPADDTLALCAEDGTVELWDPHAGTRTGTGPDVPGTVAGLAHAEDGTLILAADGERALHALAPSGELTTGPALSAEGPYWVAAGTGRRVAAVGRGDNRVQLWERETDETVQLPVVRGSAGRLVFSPDGTTLYSASPSQGVVAWSGGESWNSFETP